MSLLTRLRPAHPDERSILAEWGNAVASPYEDWGFTATGPGTRLPSTASTEELVVADASDQPLGSVSWRPVLYGPSLGSQAWDIGISLREEARGHGHGRRAQRMLADWLFATTDAHRVQATTDVTNIAEMRALEHAGFRVEGTLRGAQWRRGLWHDLVCFARLRTDE